MVDICRRCCQRHPGAIGIGRSTEEQKTDRSAFGIDPLAQDNAAHAAGSQSGMVTIRQKIKVLVQ
ncbi:MAG: hypothetical protein ACO3B3_03760 [Cyanobium sp.]